MKHGWHRHCRGCSDLETDADAVVVRLGDGRTQQVVVVEDDEAYWLSSRVASRGIVESASELALQAWRQNRATALVGFRIDRRQRLVGEAMVPKCGLSREEFLIYVRTLASECDRFEFLLTGRDRH